SVACAAASVLCLTSRRLSSHRRITQPSAQQRTSTMARLKMDGIRSRVRMASSSSRLVQAGDSPRHAPAEPGAWHPEKRRGCVWPSHAGSSAISGSNGHVHWLALQEEPQGANSATVWLGLSPATAVPGRAPGTALLWY